MNHLIYIYLNNIFIKKGSFLLHRIIYIQIIEYNEIIFCRVEDSYSIIIFPIIPIPITNFFETEICEFLNIH